MAKKLGIIVNPKGEEQNTWTKQVGGGRRIVVVSGTPPEVAWQPLKKGEVVVNPKPGKLPNGDGLYEDVMVIGHGGDGVNFFHQLNEAQYDSYVKAINGIVDGRLSVTSNAAKKCRVQVCSAGTKPIGRPFHASLELETGWETSAPKDISFIQGGSYIDLPPIINGYAINAAHIKNIVKLIKSPEKAVALNKDPLFIAIVGKNAGDEWCRMDVGQRLQRLKTHDSVSNRAVYMRS